MCRHDKITRWDRADDLLPQVLDAWRCDACDLAFIEAEAAASGLDVERLRKAGFTPDFNVCRSCHHHGSRHDLNNYCLDCIEQVDDYFTSMSKDEQWQWGVAEYARLRDE